MGLYLGPLLQAVRWDQIKGCKPLIEDWLCDMCTVHTVKSNFQMCEATLMGLYVFYQHIKNLSVELVSPKKKKLCQTKKYWAGAIARQVIREGLWKCRETISESGWQEAVRTGVCGVNLLLEVWGRVLERERTVSGQAVSQRKLGGCDGEWADRLVSKARYLPQWGSWLWGQGEFNPGDQVSN